jgi:5-methylcytosine-specific restriction enzyme subunit McrC
VVTEDGRTSTFIDLERDESKLARLFEAFVRNFYVREMPRFKLGRRNLTWMYEEEGDGGIMPSMEMDIPLESDDRIIIIDTKYYANAVVENKYAQEKLKSPNLYQMFAYMRHYPNPRDLTLTGILLYPKNDRDIDVVARSRYNTAETLHIKTLDLTRPWPDIHRQLVELVG